MSGPRPYDDAPREVGEAVVWFARRAAEAWAAGDEWNAARYASAAWRLVGEAAFIDCEDCDDEGGTTSGRT